MKTQNEQKQLATPITSENLYETASKAAYHVVRYLHATSTTQAIEKLLNGFANIKEPNNDTADAIQVAAVSLGESLNNLAPEPFVKACKDVRNYIYNQNPRQQQTINSSFYYSLLQIRKLLKGQNFKTTPKQLERLTQIIVDKGITADNIEVLIAKEKTNSKKCYTDKTVYICDFERDNYELANDDDEITNLINVMADTKSKAIKTITSVLHSPQQRRVLEYMKLGYSNSTIAVKMGISKPRVTQHIDNIRKNAKRHYPNGLSDII